MLTYNDLFNKRAVLQNIPLVLEGRKLPKETAASVMLLKVQYQHKVDDFVKILDDVKKGLKKEGFDDRAQAVEEMKRIDERRAKAEAWKEGDEGEKPQMPSQKELDKAEQTRSTLEEFEKEKKELEEALQEAQEKKAKETVNFKNCMLSKENLADIYDLVGADGEIEYTIPGVSYTHKIPKEMFLNMVAFNLVE